MVHESAETELLSTYDILGQSDSASTKQNVARARKHFIGFATRKGAKDPVEVNADSSNLVLNFLYMYCKLGGGKDDMLGESAMGGMVQGLCHLYRDNGHREAWRVSDSTGLGTGNPLNSNPDIIALRRSHRIMLAQYERITMKAQPITASIVCEHSRKFWYGGTDLESTNGPLAMDVLLHAVLLVGMNLGLRYDEMSKLRSELVSVTVNSVTLTIRTTVKNCKTGERNYTLQHWPGNAEVRASLYLNPFVALISWMRMRGNRPGPLFCDVKEMKSGSVINCGRILKSKKFQNELQGRLRFLGFGEDTLAGFSGHSLKRGAVQLYRSLRLRDEEIMRRMQMKDYAAFMRYTATFNNATPGSIPQFNSRQEYIEYASALLGEKEVLYDTERFDSFMVEVLAEKDSFEEDSSDEDGDQSGN